MLLHGHGVRTREVVVPGWTGGEPVRVRECWQRRYRCLVCGSVMVVLPPGILPRFLYSLEAVVTALLLVHTPPVGRGRPAGQTYDVQGLLAGGQAPLQRLGYRWRSLRRWGRLAVRIWWPSVSLGALLSRLALCSEDELSRTLVAAWERHLAGPEAPTIGGPHPQLCLP